MDNPSKIFDGLLVLQYRSGNKKALELLVHKYHKKLYNHSYCYTNDANISKDIVQECWIVMIRKLSGLKDPNLFGSWAFKIVTRKSLDFIKTKQREQGKLQEYYNLNTIVNEEVISNETSMGKVNTMIKNLPKDQQIVLRLFYTENYSLKEIANILEIAVGTVKSRLFHAREKLKSILK